MHGDLDEEAIIGIFLEFEAVQKSFCFLEQT
jgi:hypothetical protein